MFADERKAQILAMIARDGTVHIRDLVKAFGVTSETVRRDLNELSRSKRIRKVHGGAIAVKKLTHEDDYETRLRQNPDEKRAIGQYAAGLIADGDTVALDYGATTVEIARAIYNLKDLTILTNFLQIADILLKKQRNGDFTGKVLFLGGVLDAATARTDGGIALSMLSRFMVDKAFLTATSISAAGIAMWDESMGIFSTCLSWHAAEVYVVADSTKFDRESFYKFLDLDQVDRIITDDGKEISEQTKEAIRSAGVELHCVAVQK